MSRTRTLTVLAAIAALVLASGAARAAEEQQIVSQINGIGMLDYSAGRHNIRVGDWTKYHVKAKSELGVVDDYDVTMLIAGEEHFWGEDCFWVETWTDMPGQPPRTAATLMSYAIFDDSLAIPHMQLYMRKTINSTDENGRAVQNIFKRAASSLKMREPVGAAIHWNVDTLGTEKVTTASKGDYECRKVRIEQGTGATAQGRDSTQYTEMREIRVTYMSPKVPLTHIAREDIETSLKRRTWLIGRSQESTPMRVMDSSKGVAELVDFGSGIQARLVPAEVRHTLAEQRAAAKAAATPKRPAAKSAKGATAKR